MVDVIVETEFEEPLTEADEGERDLRLARCVRRHDVHWVRGYLSNDRRRMVCHFRAADAEAVRMAHRTADAPFVRVWTAEILAPRRDAGDPAGT